MATYLSKLASRVAAFTESTLCSKRWDVGGIRNMTKNKSPACVRGTGRSDFVTETISKWGLDIS
ncbi:MAG: hypothetical protein ACYS0I_11910 [Planctomycetota bacterium]